MAAEDIRAMQEKAIDGNRFRHPASFRGGETGSHGQIDWRAPSGSTIGNNAPTANMTIDPKCSKAFKTEITAIAPGLRSKASAHLEDSQRSRRQAAGVWPIHCRNSLHR